MLKNESINRSVALFNEAQLHIPCGVNSPVRAFGAVGGKPIYIREGHGAYLTDVDGKHYIDYVCSWGNLILGHADPRVVAAVQQATTKGLSFGACTEIEVTIAKKIKSLMPHIEKIRLVNSGTEATMSAIRLARGFTQRDKILKFTGCYHGHCDSLLVKIGTAGLTYGVPDSAGIPATVAAETLLAEYNNLEQVAAVFSAHGHDIAAIIVEPVAGNMGCVLPTADFLQGLRDLATRYASILIFDEVITGFRIALGGAQERFGVTPDLTTLGKIVGGGLPIGAFGGRADIMDCIAPQGRVYQAGTLSGNPVALAAGLATLECISERGFFAQLESSTLILVNALKKLAQQHRIPLCINQIGSMFSLFFTSLAEINDYQAVMSTQKEDFLHVFHVLLSEGVYTAPSPYEVSFLSTKHGPYEIEQTLLAFDKAFASLAASRG